MRLALIILAVLGVIELLLYVPAIWRYRRILAIPTLLGVLIGSLWLVIASFALWSTLVSFVSIYRAINLLKVFRSRAQSGYLYHTARQTSGWLIGTQAALVGFAALIDKHHLTAITGFYVLAAAELAVAVVLFASTIRHLKTTRESELDAGFADKDLPTLTVAIPARNETDDLEACLQSLIASSYQKLEILVLDDCSQNKHTPEIIKSFAQSGVRFIAGKAQPDSWLAKNYAYQQLAEEANGELLLFCGVDTRFKPDSLKNLVIALTQKNKDMMCVLPGNKLQAGVLESVLIQPSRYAWELALPRRLLERPPVLSTCWLIKHQALKAAGGFAAVRRKVVPESYFASETAKQHDGYSFICSGPQIGIESHKSFDEQMATAIRVRYPQLHRRLELVALLGLVELAVLVGPFVMMVAALVSGITPLLAVSSVSFLLLAIIQVKVVNLTYRRFLWRGLLAQPLAALFDIGLLNYSMWRYEFGEVLWKGRNICLPVMRITSNLE